MKRRILSLLCAIATVLGMVTVPAYAADTENILNDATVLFEDVENLTVETDTCIDLNGYEIKGVTVQEGATLLLRDTQTDDYDVADGNLGAVTGITGAVQAADGYVAITREGAVSFHKVDLAIRSMSLRPGNAGVYYTSNFAADQVVAEAVESYGVALSVAAEPTAENLETLCGYSVLYDFAAGAASGTLLTGIMSEEYTAQENAANAATTVYGRAYIKTAEGYTFGAAVERNLQEQVEAIDAVYLSLTETQKSGILAMYNTYKAAMADWNIPNLRGEELGDSTITVPVKTENGVVTEAVTVEQNGMSVTVPFGALVEKSELTLTVTRKAQSDSGIEATEGQTLMPFDVHVEGVSAENTVPLTVALGKVMPENLNLGNYSIYHVEATGTNPMELVANEEAFTAHNQFKYTLDGELTLHMATFSEVAAVAENKNIWNGNRDYTWYNANAETLYIRNADQLAGFGAIVGGMDGKTADDFAGQTVVLQADINIGDLTDEDGRKAPDGSNLVFYPIGYYNSTGSYNKVSGGTVTSSVSSFEGTFDGNGHTISNFYQNTWEMFGGYNSGYSGTPNHYDDAMGLFGYVVNGTVKNLTVDKFSSDGEFTPTGVIAAYAENATFENIAITNCNPRVYNTGNGGIIGIGGRTGDTTGQKLLLKNITVDNTNKISALWGSWDVACGGLVGMFRGNAAPGNGTIYFENCHVAAQIDVNNDVCANYQYYAYRYAGMMIGSVRHNTTDSNGKVVPVMTGIDASGCTVHYGKWNDYYYCELVANSIASYTHDYQFSRLTPVDAVDVENKTITVNGVTTAIPVTGRYNYVVAEWKTPTEDAKCYHFVDGNVWDHAQAGTETVNGETVLIENNQHIYLPFDQLFTGYSWGVSNIGLKDFDQSKIKILDREIADSVVKFDSIAKESYTTGTTVTIGDLFKANAQTEVLIQQGKVQVSVSPADETSTAAGTYTANAEDWTKGTLTLTGKGAATITITDYYFCTPTTITVNVAVPVAKIGEVEYTSLQEALDAVPDGGTVTLLDNVAVTEYLAIHTANLGATERSITLNLNGYTIAPAANYKYQWYPLVFVGINQTLTIEDGTIETDKHTAIGVYGSLNLNGVTVKRDAEYTDAETIVCIWNWGEDDKYYEDCQLQLTGSANIKGGDIEGGILIEGPVTFDETAKFDKLYLNTKNGYGKYNLPNGYGLVKENDYYTNLHKHTVENGACTVTGCGYAFSTSYVKTDLANIQSTDVVVVTMTKGGVTYALTSTNGTSKTPAAVVITVEGNVITSEVTGDIQWNINNTDGSLTIYPSGDNTKYLYCINDNDGIRVGSTTESGKNNQFIISSEGYLYNVNQKRYVGVYITKPDWRCYTTINSNIEGQTLAFYVLKTDCKHATVEERGEIAATCTIAGHTAGTYCLDCDTYISGGEMFNANGHDFGDPKSSEQVDTCRVKHTYRCSVCNKVSVKTVTTHTEVVDEAVAATCTETGLTEGKHCSECKEVLVAQKEIAALGHTEVTVVGKAATCTETGLTDGKQCSVCGTVTVEQTVIEAKGHDFSGGTCGTCGTEDPDYEEPSVDENEPVDVTISFATTEQRVSLSTSSQVWANEGVTLTNNKASSTTNVADYSNPVRFYKNSSLTIAAPGKITKIVINCTGIGSDYTNGWGTVTNGICTINLDGTSETYTIASFSAQTRANSITVTYIPNCTHDNTTTVSQEATCTEAGYTNATVCTNPECNMVINPGIVVEATGHSMDEGTVTTNATCTTDGVKTYTCTTCSSTKTETIEATGHIDDNGDNSCDTCGVTINNEVEPSVETLATFNLGANGSAVHADGTSKTSYTETVNGYTLSITGGTNMYTGARDAKGNSCIKLGASSKIGGFSFTVPSDVTKVVIYIAKYKANTTKVSINGKTYTISGASNNGAYDAIEIDTTTNKTVTLTTVSGGFRAMVNTIEFFGTKP